MPVLTLRPDATVALGSWTVVGAASAHQALLDSLDTSYVQLVTRCRNEAQTLRLGVDDVALPAGAKIFSVRTRVRIQTITGFTPPRCIAWYRCRKPRYLIAVIVFVVLRRLFGWRCPRTPIVSWVDQDLEYLLNDPEGAEWTQGSFNDFELQLGRDDDSTTPLRISAAYVDVNYSLPPTIVATAPTGTITDVGRLTVTWTYSDPASDPQQAFLVRVFNAAQYGVAGFDPLTSPAYDESGWVLGEALAWTMNRDVVNGPWRAYLRVQKAWLGAGSYLSEVVFTSWTQSVAGAVTPVLTAVFEPALNRVALAVSPSSADPVTAAYTIETSHDLGLTWGPVRDAAQVPANGMTPVTVFDHEAPLNRVVQYRALGFRQVGDVRYPSGAFSTVAQVVPEIRQFWLKDPLAPGLNAPLPIRAAGNDTPKRPRPVKVFEPLTGAGVSARKIVVSGPVFGVEGALALVFTARFEAGLWEKFGALYDSGRTLLLQYPTGEQRYVRLGGDLAWTWQLQDTDVPYRFASVSYTEVVRPPVETLEATP